MGNIELLIAKNNKLHKPKKNSGIDKPNIPATVRMVSAKLPFRSALKIPSKQPKNEDIHKAAKESSSVAANFAFTILPYTY